MQDPFLLCKDSLSELCAHTLLVGAGQLKRLESLAQQEGSHIRRIWQSNCFTNALEHLGVTHCQSMSPETKSR